MNKPQDPPRVADACALGRFVNALFRHASAGGVVSLRGFNDTRRSDPPWRIEPIPLNGAGLDPVISKAAALATEAANAPEPIVFCPPVAVFRDDASAAADNLAEGMALSVDCDEAPANARETLVRLLGPPTVEVESGGEWTDPKTGEVQPKLHLHWRLAEPTRTAEEHARLKRARRLAAALVSGDGSGAPLAHPFRWPGSWHRKDKPRLARIAALNDVVEIDLGAALGALEAETARRGLNGRGDGSGPEDRETDLDFNGAARQGIHIDAGGFDNEAPAAEVEEALGYIDPDLPYPDWVAVLMALHDHFGGRASSLPIGGRGAAGNTSPDASRGGGRTSPLAGARPSGSCSSWRGRTGATLASWRAGIAPAAVRAARRAAGRCAGRQTSPPRNPRRFSTRYRRASPIPSPHSAR
jgi:hypothetical protein